LIKRKDGVFFHFEFWTIGVRTKNKLLIKMEEGTPLESSRFNSPIELYVVRPNLCFGVECGQDKLSIQKRIWGGH